MPPGRHGTPWQVLALVVLVGLGACLTAVSALVPAMLGAFGGWPALAVGLGVLAVALAALWRIQRRRDRMLR